MNIAGCTSVKKKKDQSWKKVNTLVTDDLNCLFICLVTTKKKEDGGKQGSRGVVKGYDVGLMSRETGGSDVKHLITAP